VRLPRTIERSLPRKVTLLVLATTLLALLLSATGLVVYDLLLYESQRSGDFLSQAEVLARATAPALSFNDQRSAEKDLSVLQVRSGILEAVFYTRSGQLCASYVRPGAAQSAPALAPRATGYMIGKSHI